MFARLRTSLDENKDGVMTTVFIGGSRRLARLNNTIKSRLDNIIRQNFSVVIGDANGTDKAVQSYLGSKGYRNVTVYCMEESCRNNLANWPTRSIRVDRSKKDFTYYATKDQEMANAASYGLMIWDGKSKGTINNILNLLAQRKRVLVYFSPHKSCLTLKSLEDIPVLLGKCGEDDKRRLKRVLSVATVHSDQEELDLSGDSVA